MKNNFFNSLNLVFLAGIMMIGILLTSCSKEEMPLVEKDKEFVTSNEMVNIPFFVRNLSGQLPSAPNDLLFDVRGKNPVTAPDGHLITWAEWSAVRGNIYVECQDAGTFVSLKLSGLIPNGVYTMWNVSVAAPGFDPTVEGFNVTGIGAAGKGDGSDNSFIASPNGKAQISMLSPGGDLSMFGEITNCPVKDQFEWHIVGSYHIDGMTYGPDLGPDGTVAEQFGFIFNSEL